MATCNSQWIYSYAVVYKYCIPFVEYELPLNSSLDPPWMYDHVKAYIYVTWSYVHSGSYVEDPLWTYIYIYIPLWLCITEGIAEVRPVMSNGYEDHTSATVY